MREKIAHGLATYIWIRRSTKMGDLKAQVYLTNDVFNLYI
jgi:hypothetical protein